MLGALERKHSIAREIIFSWGIHKRHISSNLCLSVSSVQLGSLGGRVSSLILSIFGCVQRSISGREKGNEFERLVRNNLVKPELVLLGRTGNK